MTDDERQLLDEQIAYYRARAAEYDETSTPDGDPFVEHGEAVRAALQAFEPRGRVLEIAAGTGQWTSILAEFADDLIVTDSSPEMLALNRARVGERAGRLWRVADAFSLPAGDPFDVVFFGFFLSHVPHESFDAFWNGVASMLRPGGRAFIVDEADHGLWDEDWLDRDAGIVRRTLLDGSVHRAVKVLWEPADLQRRLARLGWAATVHAEGPFYWAVATRRPDNPGRRSD